MKLSSTDLLSLEHASMSMFNPIERRSEGAWIALVSAVPNRRANAIYPLGPPPERLDPLLSLYAVHDRLIRCKVPRWITDDVTASLESLSLRPVYGAHVLAAPVQQAPSDAGVELTDTLDARWLSINRDFSAAATYAYGSENTSLLAARIDDVAVGLAVVSGGWAGVAGMYTDPAHREHGLGSRILGRLLAESADRGATRCFLQVVESNRRAIGLYESFGFQAATAYDYWE